MEMVILFVGIVVPFLMVGLYALYRTNKEEREEHKEMEAKNA